MRLATGWPDCRRPGASSRCGWPDSRCGPRSRTRGPFPASAVAARYGLGVAVVATALRRLAAEGRVAEGEFLAGRRGTEWCDSEVLRLLRRRCLARLRKEAEPVPPQVL